VVTGLLRNAGATPKPNTFNFEVGLITNDQMSGETVLAEVVEALEETIAQVVSDVEFLTLTLVLVVVEEPERESVGVVLLLELFDTFTLLVLDINEESLEVEQVESGGRKKIKGIRLLLLWFVFIIIIVFRFSGGSFLSWGSGFLFFNLDYGFDSLSSNLNVTGNSHEFRECSDALEPSRKFGHGLSESTVEECLLSNDEEACKSNISKSHSISDEPVSSESTVDGLSVGLNFIEGGSEVGLEDIGPSMDCLNCWHLVRDEFGHSPKAPLVNLCALNIISAEKSGVTVSQVLGNSNRFTDGALWGLEQWELASSVQCFELFGVFCLFSDNLDFECLAIEFGSDSSDERVEVEGIVDVDFL
jgi:hypothetical protein